MRNEDLRKKNIDILLQRLTTCKEKGKDVIEKLLNQFAYEKGLTRATVNGYYEVLNGAGLI